MSQLYHTNIIHLHSSLQAFISVCVFLSGAEINVKELAGKWHIVWDDITKSQEQILGKQYTAVISHDGIFNIVSPHSEILMPLSRSTNDKFPANAGWYQNSDDGTMFVRLKKDGNMVMHYFDESRKDICTRTYKGISSYCTTAIGTRKSKLCGYYFN